MLWSCPSRLDSEVQNSMATGALNRVLNRLHVRLHVDGIIKNLTSNTLVYKKQKENLIIS